MMNGRLKELKNKLATEKGQLQRIESELETTQTQFSSLEIRHGNILKAREVLQMVAKQTQEKLEYHISGLVSTALAAVFDDPYEFGVHFIERRGRTECDLVFKKENEECNPLDASGGGAVDVASFALRVAFLSMENPKSRRVLILDEPFRFVSPDLQAKASGMLKKISSRIGLQIIAVSHAEEIINSADEVYEVSKVGDVSKVNLL